MEVNRGTVGPAHILFVLKDIDDPSGAGRSLQMYEMRFGQPPARTQGSVSADPHFSTGILQYFRCDSSAMPYTVIFPGISF